MVSLKFLILFQDLSGNNYSSMSKKLSLLGYLILFTLIFFFISSFLKEQVIYIEAGPKGGFFDTSAHVLKKRLKEYDINAEVINLSLIHI